MPANESYDVVVIGSGAAGMACAVASAELGLSCLVLEKAEKLGGGTAISGGALWVGANVAAGMYSFAEQAPQALEFFESHGIPFQLTASTIITASRQGRKPPAGSSIRRQ
jgi:3-oxosteroid 1-dehydrogenase